MNLKKIGLSALAASLVATSAFSAEFGVSGSAGITIENNSQNSSGRAFSMPNSVYLSGSGETDGGLTISASFELDQGAGANGGPFDNHSVSVGSDSFGTLTIHGHGGSSAQSALDTTAAGDLWDNGFGINTSTHTPKASATANNMLVYSLPSMVDGLAASVSFTPKASAALPKQKPSQEFKWDDTIPKGSGYFMNLLKADSLPAPPGSPPLQNTQKAA